MDTATGAASWAISLNASSSHLPTDEAALPTQVNNPISFSFYFVDLIEATGAIATTFPVGNAAAVPAAIC